MLRFKVKDLIIGQISEVGLLTSGPCQDLLTDRPCADDPEHGNTVYPCRRNAVPETKVACAANSDTSLGCVQDVEDITVRPCYRSTTRNNRNKCADKGDMPKEHKTKYYCMQQDDTKVPCKGGSNTEIPGMPRNPWQGCLEGSNTKKACAPVPVETRFECIADSDTRQPCMQGSNTQTPCAYRHGNPPTRLQCRFSNTKHACNTEEKSTRFACEEGKQNITREFCKTENTQRDPNCGSRTIYCEWLTLKETTPFADAGPAGAAPCPPLSALAIPDTDPRALEALVALREDLRGALGVVEARQRDVEALLRPRNVKEAEELERTLARALEETKKLKQRLVAEERPRGAKPKRKGKGA
jgi:hypothetical protein